MAYSPFVLLLSLFLLFLSPPTQALPSFLSRISSTHENTCQCSCCYSVGLQDRTECIPAIDTSFDISTCSDCHVEKCSKTFPISCAQSSSIVSSSCIIRKGWMLRLVPMVFLLATLALIIYGVFFKRYDGYHDTRVPTRPVLTEVLPAHYSTFASFPLNYGPAASDGGRSGDERTGLMGRSSTALPTISETAEVTGPTEPQDIIPETAPPRFGTASTSLAGFMTTFERALNATGEDRKEEHGAQFNDVHSVSQHVKDQGPDMNEVVSALAKGIEDSNVVNRLATDLVHIPMPEEHQLADKEMPSSEERVPPAAEESPATAEESPATMEEPPAAVEEPPATMEEPPATVEEPPATVEEPPAAVEEPPAVVEEPHITVEEPPAVVEEPHTTVEEPPAAVEEPPATVEEPPAAVEEPPATVEESPATVEESPATVEEPPATVEEPPAAVEEPPAAVEEPTATVEESPATMEESPATAEEPPATVEESPATVEEFPATMEEPPATMEEPPAAVVEPPAAVEEPPATAEEPPATAEEPSASAEEPSATAEEPPATVEEPLTTVEEAPTVDEGEHLADEEASSANHNPDVEDAPHAQEEDPATDTGAAATEEEAPTADDGEVVADREASPTNKDSADVPPADEEEPATDKAPAVDEEAPATEEGAPTAHEKAPVAVEEAPSAGKESDAGDQETEAGQTFKKDVADEVSGYASKQLDTVAVRASIYPFPLSSLDIATSELVGEASDQIVMATRTFHADTASFEVTSSQGVSEDTTGTDGIGYQGAQAVTGDDSQALEARSFNTNNEAADQNPYPVVLASEVDSAQQGMLKEKKAISGLRYSEAEGCAIVVEKSGGHEVTDVSDDPGATTYLSSSTPKSVIDDIAVLLGVCEPPDESTSEMLTEAEPLETATEICDVVIKSTSTSFIPETEGGGLSGLGYGEGLSSGCNADDTAGEVDTSKLAGRTEVDVTSCAQTSLERSISLSIGGTELAGQSTVASLDALSESEIFCFRERNVTANVGAGETEYAVGAEGLLISTAISAGAWSHDNKGASEPQHANELEDSSTGLGGYNEGPHFQTDSSIQSRLNNSAEQSDTVELIVNSESILGAAESEAIINSVESENVSEDAASAVDPGQTLAKEIESSTEVWNSIETNLSLSETLYIHPIVNKDAEGAAEGSIVIGEADNTAEKSTSMKEEYRKFSHTLEAVETTYDVTERTATSNDVDRDLTEGAAVEDEIVKLDSVDDGASEVEGLKCDAVESTVFEYDASEGDSLEAKAVEGSNFDVRVLDDDASETDVVESIAFEGVAIDDNDVEGDAFEGDDAEVEIVESDAPDNVAVEPGALDGDVGKSVPVEENADDNDRIGGAFITSEAVEDDGSAHAVDSGVFDYDVIEVDIVRPDASEGDAVDDIVVDSGAIEADIAVANITDGEVAGDSAVEGRTVMGSADDGFAVGTHAVERFNVEAGTTDDDDVEVVRVDNSSTENGNAETEASSSNSDNVGAVDNGATDVDEVEDEVDEVVFPEYSVEAGGVEDGYHASFGDGDNVVEAEAVADICVEAGAGDYIGPGGYDAEDRCLEETGDNALTVEDDADLSGNAEDGLEEVVGVDNSAVKSEALDCNLDQGGGVDNCDAAAEVVGDDGDEVVGTSEYSVEAKDVKDGSDGGFDDRDGAFEAETVDYVGPGDFDAEDGCLEDTGDNAVVVEEGIGQSWVAEANVEEVVGVANVLVDAEALVRNLEEGVDVESCDSAAEVLEDDGEAVVVREYSTEAEDVEDVGEAGVGGVDDSVGAEAEAVDDSTVEPRAVDYIPGNLDFEAGNTEEIGDNSVAVVDDVSESGGARNDVKEVVGVDAEALLRNLDDVGESGGARNDVKEVVGVDAEALVRNLEDVVDVDNCGSAAEVSEGDGNVVVVPEYFAEAEDVEDVGEEGVGGVDDSVGAEAGAVDDSTVEPRAVDFIVPGNLDVEAGNAEETGDNSVAVEDDVGESGGAENDVKEVVGVDNVLVDAEALVRNLEDVVDVDNCGSAAEVLEGDGNVVVVPEYFAEAEDVEDVGEEGVGGVEESVGAEAGAVDDSTVEPRAVDFIVPGNLDVEAGNAEETGDNSVAVEDDVGESGGAENDVKEVVGVDNVLVDAEALDRNLEDVVDVDNCGSAAEVLEGDGEVVVVPEYFAEAEDVEDVGEAGVGGVDDSVGAEAGAVDDSTVEPRAVDFIVPGNLDVEAGNAEETGDNSVAVEDDVGESGGAENDVKEVVGVDNVLVDAEALDRNLEDVVDVDNCGSAAEVLEGDGEVVVVPEYFAEAEDVEDVGEAGVGGVDDSVGAEAGAVDDSTVEPRAVDFIVPGNLDVEAGNAEETGDNSVAVEDDVGESGGAENDVKEVVGVDNVLVDAEALDRNLEDGVVVANFDSAAEVLEGDGEVVVVPEYFAEAEDVEDVGEEGVGGVEESVGAEAGAVDDSTVEPRAVDFIVPGNLDVEAGNAEETGDNSVAVEDDVGESGGAENDVKEVVGVDNVLVDAEALDRNLEDGVDVDNCGSAAEVLEDDGDAVVVREYSTEAEDVEDVGEAGVGGVDDSVGAEAEAVDDSFVEPRAVDHILGNLDFEAGNTEGTGDNSVAVEDDVGESGGARNDVKEVVGVDAEALVRNLEDVVDVDNFDSAAEVSEGDGNVVVVPEYFAEAEDVEDVGEEGVGGVEESVGAEAGAVDDSTVEPRAVDFIVPGNLDVEAGNAEETGDNSVAVEDDVGESGGAENDVKEVVGVDNVLVDAEALDRNLEDGVDVDNCGSAAEVLEGDGEVVVVPEYFAEAEDVEDVGEAGVGGVDDSVGAEAGAVDDSTVEPRAVDFIVPGNLDVEAGNAEETGDNSVAVEDDVGESGGARNDVKEVVGVDAEALVRNLEDVVDVDNCGSAAEVSEGDGNVVVVPEYFAEAEDVEDVGEEGVGGVDDSVGAEAGAVDDSTVEPRAVDFIVPGNLDVEAGNAEETGDNSVAVEDDVGESGGAENDVKEVVGVDNVLVDAEALDRNLEDGVVVANFDSAAEVLEGDGEVVVVPEYFAEAEDVEDVGEEGVGGVEESVGAEAGAVDDSTVEPRAVDFIVPGNLDVEAGNAEETGDNSVAVEDDVGESGGAENDVKEVVGVDNVLVDAEALDRNLEDGVDVDNCGSAAEVLEGDGNVVVVPEYFAEAEDVEDVGEAGVGGVEESVGAEAGAVDDSTVEPRAVDFIVPGNLDVEAGNAEETGDNSVAVEDDVGESGGAETDVKEVVGVDNVLVDAEALDRNLEDGVVVANFDSAAEVLEGDGEVVVVPEYFAEAEDVEDVGEEGVGGVEESVGAEAGAVDDSTVEPRAVDFIVPGNLDVEAGNAEETGDNSVAVEDDVGESGGAENDVKEVVGVDNVLVDAEALDRNLEDGVDVDNCGSAAEVLEGDGNVVVVPEYFAEAEDVEDVGEAGVGGVEESVGAEAGAVDDSTVEPRAVDFIVPGNLDVEAGNAEETGDNSVAVEDDVGESGGAENDVKEVVGVDNVLVDAEALVRNLEDVVDVDNCGSAAEVLEGDGEVVVVPEYFAEAEDVEDVGEEGVGGVEESVGAEAGAVDDSTVEPRAVDFIVPGNLDVEAGNAEETGDNSVAVEDDVGESGGAENDVKEVVGVDNVLVDAEALVRISEDVVDVDNCDSAAEVLEDDGDAVVVREYSTEAEDVEDVGEEGVGGVDDSVGAEAEAMHDSAEKIHFNDEGSDADATEVLADEDVSSSAGDVNVQSDWVYSEVVAENFSLGIADEKSCDIYAVDNVAIEGDSVNLEAGMRDAFEFDAGADDVERDFIVTDFVGNDTINDEDATRDIFQSLAVNVAEGAPIEVHTLNNDDDDFDVIIIDDDEAEDDEVIDNSIEEDFPIVHVVDDNSEADTSEVHIFDDDDVEGYGVRNDTIEEAYVELHVADYNAPEGDAVDNNSVTILKEEPVGDNVTTPTDGEEFASVREDGAIAIIEKVSIVDVEPPMVIVGLENVGFNTVDGMISVAPEDVVEGNRATNPEQNTSFLVEAIAEDEAVLTTGRGASVCVTSGTLIGEGDVDEGNIEFSVVAGIDAEETETIMENVTGGVLPIVNRVDDSVLEEDPWVTAAAPENKTIGVEVSKAAEAESIQVGEEEIGESNKGEEVAIDSGVVGLHLRVADIKEDLDEVIIEEINAEGVVNIKGENSVDLPHITSAEQKPMEAAAMESLMEKVESSVNTNQGTPTEVDEMEGSSAVVEADQPTTTKLSSEDATPAGDEPGNEIGAEVAGYPGTSHAYN